MKKFFSSHIVLSVFLGVLPTAAASEWEKISDDDGITVYQKIDAKDETGGAHGTGVSLRGETVIPARLDDVIEVMKDNNKASQWIPMVVSRKDLKQISDVERVEYTHLKMPWPLTDRYFINRARADRLENGQLRIFVQSVEQPDVAWIESDKVLGFLHYSEFMLTPVEGGSKTHMTLEVNSDPKGLIPKFLVRAVQKSWPRKFFNGLNRMLKESAEESAKENPEAKKSLVH